jgi:cobalamin biosynthesis protein CobW
MAVVLVNAEQLAELRDLDGLFEQQVTAADLLVLNQIDRVDAAEVAALEARLRAIEPEVPIVRAVQARVDPVLLRPIDRAGGARDASAQPPHDHTAHAAFVAEVIAVEPGVVEAALVARLRALGAVRAKGFVETAEGPRLVQGVGRRIELTPATPPDPALLGQLVVIRRSGRL